MNVYAESSAVLAWLLGEDAGDAVRAALAAAEVVVASDLTLVECDRVLHRAAAGGDLTVEEVSDRAALLQAASDHWHVLAMDAEVVARARRRFPHEPIRTLDALHLSTALLTRSLVAEVGILTLDERIRSNAVELGFTTVPEPA